MAKRRRRVSREDVRDNARKGAGGANWFNLPPNVRNWAPDKPGKYMVDFLPYEVTSKNHPDGRQPGDVWYKFPFAVHHGVGVRNESIICPTTIGKKCPICEESNRLSAEDKELHKDSIKKLRPQKYAAYNIDNPDDPKNVAIFAVSRGKFAIALEKELDEGDEDVLAFFDTTEDGKTLKLRFSEETFDGRKYLKCTRIDFLDRDELDEDKTFKRTVNLDEMFNVIPYNKLKSVFLEIEEDSDEGGERTKPKPRGHTGDDEEEEEKPKRQGCRKKEEKDDEGDDDPKEAGDADEGDADDESQEEEKPTLKKRGKTKKDKVPECPAGGTFGKSLDQHDECDDCPLWEACEEATGT
jgi:hypothetical protein